jgi:hypothetical protein
MSRAASASAPLGELGDLFGEVEKLGSSDAGKFLPIWLWINTY